MYLVFISRQATWGSDALKTWQILIILLWMQSISAQSDWGLCLLRLGLEGGHDPPRLQLLNQVLMTGQLHTLNPLWSTSNSCILRESSRESSIASCVLFALNHPLQWIDFQYVVRSENYVSLLTRYMMGFVSLFALEAWNREGVWSPSIWHVQITASVHSSKILMICEGKPRGGSSSGIHWQAATGFTVTNWPANFRQTWTPTAWPWYFYQWSVHGFDKML